MDREGTYFGTVLGAKGDTAKSGSAQLVVEIELSHYFGQEWEELPVKIVRKIYWSLSPKALPYTMERLEAIGFNGDLDNPAFTYNEMDRKSRPKFVNKHSEYQGKTSDRWDIAGKFGGGSERSISQETKNEFAKAWRERKGGGAPQGPESVPF